MNKQRKQFPIFKNQPNLSYLDSAATTQTPATVLDAMNEYYTDYRANVHRGIYNLSERATDAYEGAREAVAKFINADSQEIFFTSGATHGLNHLAYCLGSSLSSRDNVVLTQMEHHANLVPWQQLAKRYGFELRFIGLRTTDYGLQLEMAKKLIDKNTKIVSFTAASNVLGTINPIEEIIKITRHNSPRAVTIVDAAQAAAHLPLDVKKLDCDFLVFSGHKIYGPTGIGVLFGKKELLAKKLEPFLFGGEMVSSVTYENATWNDIPWRFEAGTPNIAGAIGLGAAVKFIQKIGWKEITNHEKKITKKLINELIKNDCRIIGPTLLRHSEEADIRRLTSESPNTVSDNPTGLRRRSFLTPRNDAFNRIGVVSFVVPGVHPHDVAEVFASEGVCVRAGFHCAEPLHNLLGLNGTARASIGIYNTEEDIEKLITGIKKIKRTFRNS